MRRAHQKGEHGKTLRRFVCRYLGINELQGHFAQAIARQAKLLRFLASIMRAFFAYGGQPENVY